MFMVGLVAPLAIEFGASKVLIEGFSETSKIEPFSGQEKWMEYFNRGKGPPYQSSFVAVSRLQLFFRPLLPDSHTGKLGEKRADISAL